jgi:penicillin-binding protein 2
MVVTNGTARNAKIQGINVCAKTGTVENYYRGKKQQNHSFFVAFAPKEDPKIAICVVVENAGYGSTWAAPIASLLMEKYLNDTLAGKKRLDEVERISKASVMPARIKHQLHVRDSLKRRSDSAQTRKKRNGITARSSGLRPFYIYTSHNPFSSSNFVMLPLETGFIVSNNLRRKRKDTNYKSGV